MVQVLLILQFLDTGYSTLKDLFSVFVQILMECELCAVLAGGDGEGAVDCILCWCSSIYRQIKNKTWSSKKKIYDITD